MDEDFDRLVNWIGVATIVAINWPTLVLRYKEFKAWQERRYNKRMEAMFPSDPEPKDPSWFAQARVEIDRLTHGEA